MTKFVPVISDVLIALKLVNLAFQGCLVLKHTAESLDDYHINASMYRKLLG